MESTLRAEPNQPNGLLAALMPHGVLVQPEVAITRGLCWLLGLADAAGALDALVLRNGIEPGGVGQWLTEVRDQDGGRTDLEYSWGDPTATRVVVEAKIGHLLTEAQVAWYRTHIGAGGGLLAVLVPEARREEAQRVIEALAESADYPELSDDGPIKLDVWSYDEVIWELEEHLPDSPDVAQFRGLVQACRALDIMPISELELLDDNAARLDDIWRVVDSASFGLFGRRLPAGSDGSLAHRRYVDLAPYELGMAVGVGRKTREQDGVPQPWAWLRLPDAPAHSRFTRQVLEGLRPGRSLRDRGEIWLPLRVPTMVWGSAMIQSVHDEIEEISNAIRVKLDGEGARFDATHAGLQMSVVLGMEPIEPVDLLDDSPARRSDIELILTEATRPLYEGKIWPFVKDVDYLRNRWVSVAQLGTWVSTSTGRQGPSIDNQPQPWAWMRVNDATAHADVTFAALEDLAPGRVVVDRLDRSIPFDIPSCATGPEMLKAVHDQIRQAIAAIVEAVTAHNGVASQDPAI